MNIDPALLSMAGVNLLIIASAWGDLRAQVKAGREKNDERHEENVDRLKDIASDLRRINGTVAAHSEALDQLQARLDRHERQ